METKKRNNTAWRLLPVSALMLFSTALLAGKVELIYQITGVNLAQNKSNPPQLVITANGNVTTGGWSNPRLVRRPGKVVNGIYEFNFLADKPGGMVPQVISPVKASYTMKKIPTDLKGVRVYSSSNSQEASWP